MLAFTCMFAKIYINRTPVGYTIHKGSLNTLTIKTAIGTIDSNILLYSINFHFMRIINQIFYCRCKDQAGWLFQNQTIANQQSGKYNLNLMYFKTHLCTATKARPNNMIEHFIFWINMNINIVWAFCFPF